ncbi:hypothetical protein DV737_g3646, partial [Chaetothyriales sp. CBS 132003]
MPRLAPPLLRQARRHSRHLLSLLTECRDLESAKNELRWLTEHARHLQSPDGHKLWQRSLAGFVRRRAQGEPLQYIIGDQPFGDLEILCRPEVLIPRPETETYSRSIASLLEALGRSGHLLPPELKVLDLCSGTGCIGLLLHSLLRRPPFHATSTKRLLVTGIDVSDVALKLACQNLEHNIRLGLLQPEARQQVSFQHADLLGSAEQLLRGHALSKSGLYDVIISNPPYISPTDYAAGGRVTRSVRDYEPLLALVPPHMGDDQGNRADIFYSRILHVGRLARTRLICMEVGDAAQAARVARLAEQFSTDYAGNVEAQIVEVWCDDGHVSEVDVSHLYQYHVRGCERAVVIWKGAWAHWRRSVSGAQVCS